MSTRIILLFYEILNGREEINWNRFIMNKLQATSLLQICLTDLIRCVSSFIIRFPVLKSGYLFPIPAYFH